MKQERYDKKSDHRSSHYGQQFLHALVVVNDPSSATRHLRVVARARRYRITQERDAELDGMKG